MAVRPGGVRPLPGCAKRRGKEGKEKSQCVVLGDVHYSKHI